MALLINWGVIRSHIISPKLKQQWESPFWRLHEWKAYPWFFPPKKSVLSKRNRSLSNPTIYILIFRVLLLYEFKILFNNLIFMAQSLCPKNWGIESLDDSQMVPSPNRANSNVSIFISIAFGIIRFFKCEKNHFASVPSQHQLVESGQNEHHPSSPV